MLVWIDETPEGLDQISAFSEDGNRAVRVRVESFTPNIHKNLVLEAGVAYEATGRTPSQLQARVAELETALREVVRNHEDPPSNDRPAVVIARSVLNP